MLSFDEIMDLTPEEFSAKWKTNEVQDSSLKILGCRSMTEADRDHLNNKD